MAQVPVGEIRRYRALSQEVARATDARSLSDIAVRTDGGLTQWLLLELMKDALAQRARHVGVPCRADSELCFEYLLELGHPQIELFRENNASREVTSSSLTDWAVAQVREVVHESREDERCTIRIETDDERPLDVDLHVTNLCPRLDVLGHFSGPVDHDAAARWAGLIELDVRIDERFNDWAELRAILARTIRHELEHAHDVEIPRVCSPEGLSQLEAFRRYILAPREISAWSAHIADEGNRNGLELHGLLQANGQIVAEAAVRHGATPEQADQLATVVVSAWSRALVERGPPHRSC